ncbi:MAG: choice-of-anchor K domain-containing protein [Verrucomicrobiae bacterium]|nr:choice-of-anchor K domain-containing protein [Verrucomicrobiae bacterium]MCB1089907.1 choice-of-anchor K domain-containing protein [Verrucomicrobiae bacterium]
MSPPSPTHTLRRTPIRGAYRWAFSLIEVMVTVVVIGVVAAIAYVATGNIAGVAKSEKVRSDVASINSAIDIYLANGGSLDGLTSPADILAKMKTQRDSSDARRHTGGPSGRMIDPRIIAVPVAASDSQMRAVYNSAEKRFDLASSGNGFRFELDDSLNELNISNETRKQATVVYSGSDSWVWDYNNSLTNPTNLPNVTKIPTSSAPADTTPPSTLPPPDPDPEPEPEPAPPVTDPRTQLAAPILNPPGGYYQSNEFPISVTIGNLPAAAIGKVRFATRFNGVWVDWADYAGQTLSVPKDGEVWAQAIAVDTVNYRDSWQAYGYYSKVTPPKLPTPILSLPGGAYARDNFPLSLSLNNVPAPGLADAKYRIDSGAWANYSGPVTVGKNQTFAAQYVTKNSDAYQDSDVRSEYYYPIASNLSGSVSGTFQNASGGPTLVQKITDGGTFFSHGDPTIDLGGEIVDAGEPNTLKFEAAPFSGVAANQAFKIGDLFYHNGTTFNDSHASGVQLNVNIGLADPAQNIQFALNFDLVNTENTGDAQSSADFVRITNLSQNIGLTIDGISYTLQLNFGGTDSFGFSTSNEFHVYEGATGRGTINGTFIAHP